jgi:hypothetical protein
LAGVCYGFILVVTNWNKHILLKSDTWLGSLSNSWKGAFFLGRAFERIKGVLPRLPVDIKLHLVAFSMEQALRRGDESLICDLQIVWDITL